MKIFITGGTGFVGSFLSKRLLASGHQVTILTRETKAPVLEIGDISYLQGDPTIRGDWQKAVAEHQVIINLAGASIFSRWNKKQKQILRDSRILTSRNLVEALPADSNSLTFFSASAAGYYEFNEDEELIESSPAGNDFLAHLAYDWEKEAMNSQKKGARVVIARFGMVLGKNGGVLAQLLPLFKYFLGGPLGDGRQWFSWIHLEDLANAFVFLLEQKDIAGAVNFCSPQPVRNKELGAAIGRVLHRPSLVSPPGFMIKPVLGKFAVLLNGQKVAPKRLLDAGYKFQYPDIDEALKNIIGD